MGMTLQVLLKLKSIQQKARVANMSLNIMQYFKEDWISLCASVATLGLVMFFIVDAIEYLKENSKALLIIKLGFAFVGYTGSDIASRIFGVMSSRINSVIDVKTNIADNKIEETIKNN